LLGTDRRRLVIEALQRGGGSEKLRDFTEAVAARESATGPPIGPV